MYRPAFIYLPACLISQTGGLSTFSPRTALSSRGSLALTAFGSATVSAYVHMINIFKQICEMYVVRVQEWIHISTNKSQQIG